MKEKLRGLLAASTQIVCWPLFWFLAYILCRCNVKSYFFLPKERNARFVIAANHQSRLDPFILTGIFSPLLWPVLLPYRYITANQYLYSLSYGWFLWPLGSFPASQSRIEGHGLKRAVTIVDNNQTICIFPEGQRATPHSVEPKKGVAVLAQLPNVFVVPVHIQWSFIKSKKCVSVIIGKPYKAKGHSSKQILDAIYALS